MKTTTIFLICLFAIALSSCGVFRKPKTPLDPTFDEGIVINGIRWATRNVDAPGTFAPTPESAGMFFQWNRKKAWATTDIIGGRDNSNPEGTKWYAENDPCPDGWRVPTIEELQSLYDAGSIWTRRNRVRGRLFGTAPYQLFLPATGGIDADGRHGGVGRSGSYWGSTQDDLILADYLWFSGGVMIHVDRSWRPGMGSVRCVAIE